MLIILLNLVNVNNMLLNFAILALCPIWGAYNWMICMPELKICANPLELISQLCVENLECLDRLSLIIKLEE